MNDRRKIRISFPENDKQELICVVILFLLSIVIWAVIGGFRKKEFELFDETYYLHIARSLANGRGFQTYNTDIEFTKILYCILIAPAYIFFKDHNAILTAVQAINLVILSSVIIPYYFIARKVIRDRRMRLVAMALLIILPEMHFSMTFLTENTYYPMTAWFVWMIMKYLEGSVKHRYRFDCLMGVFAYLLYITKKSALYMCVALGVFFLWEVLECRNKEKRKKLLEKRACDGTIMVVIFSLMDVLGKYLWFADIGKISGVSASVTGTVDYGAKVIEQYSGNTFAVYCVIYCIVNIILAGGILPVLLPAFFRKELNPDAKRLYRYTLIVSVIGAFFIGVLIMAREDVGEKIPRALLRYIMYIWMSYIIVFLSMWSDVKEKIDIKKTVILAVILIAAALFYPGALDQSMLIYVWTHFNYVLWQYKAAIIIAGLIAVPLFCLNRRVLILGFTVVFTGISLLNDLYIYRHYRGAYGVSEEDQKYCLNIEDMIEKDPEHNYVILVNGNYDTARFTDTYFTADNAYIVWQNEGEYIIGDEKKKVEPHLGSAFDLTHVDYLIMRTGEEFADTSAISKVAGFDDRIFTLYNNNDILKLPDIRFKEENPDNSWR